MHSFWNILFYCNRTVLLLDLQLTVKLAVFCGRYYNTWNPLNQYLFGKKMSVFRIINFIVGCSESNKKLVRAQLRDYVPKSISHVLFCLSRLTTLSMRCHPYHPDFRVLEWNSHSQSATENRSRSGWMWMVSRQMLRWLLQKCSNLFFLLIELTLSNETPIWKLVFLLEISIW